MKIILLGVVALFSISLHAQWNDSIARHLIALPLKCVEQEYPNKLGQVLSNEKQLAAPSDLHPMFYGCFDWHSSVHGHWLMVSILKSNPNITEKTQVEAHFAKTFTAENVAKELAFFQTKYNESFERTYGWAWLMKLQQELDTWDHPEAKTWAKNLQPYTDSLCTKLELFLPKLVYPIRSGDHINTAFGLAFAFDYAVHANKVSLKQSIETHAKRFYLNDRNYTLRFEPSGYDFLSPGLEEADLMLRILPSSEYLKWLKQFLPELFDRKFCLEPGKVIDRTDGKLVHLDGLNFSRTWCLMHIASSTPKLSHLEKIATAHLNYSLPKIVDGDYMGEHWLASFALEALISINKKAQ